MRGGMKPHTLLALTLGVAQVARAEVPDPAVHTPAARLDQARATVYKQKALDLRVASPQLLSSNTGRADPPAPQAWRIVHPKGHEVSVENVAAKLHRTRELEEFPREIDSTAAWVGGWILVAAASVGSTVPLLLATDSESETVEAVGATAGVTGGVGLITLIIGAVLHSTSDHEVPLSVATNMVREYNEGLAIELGAAAAPAGVIASPELAASPDRASPAAPSVRLGLRLFESEGVRITEVVHATASALRAGDLLLSMDDIPMPTLAALRSYTARLRPGDTVKLRVRRSSVELDVSLHL